MTPRVRLLFKVYVLLPKANCLALTNPVLAGELNQAVEGFRRQLVILAAQFVGVHELALAFSVQLRDLGHGLDQLPAFRHTQCFLQRCTPAVDGCDLQASSLLALAVFGQRPDSELIDQLLIDLVQRRGC